MPTLTDVKSIDDKRVEIRLTEAIVHTDTPPEINRKRELLKQSLQRHGVPAGSETITEEFIGPQRCLVGVGMGKPFEMTEEMEKRRKDENELAMQAALVKIAQTLSPVASGAIDPKAATEISGQLDEMRALAKQAAEDRAAAADLLDRVKAAAQANASAAADPQAVPVVDPQVDEEAAAKAAAAGNDAGQAATKAKK